MHAHELPIRIRANVLGVIIHLRLIGGKLLLAVGGNTSVPSHLASAPGIYRHFGMERFRCRNYSDITIYITLNSPDSKPHAANILSNSIPYFRAIIV